VLQFLEKFTGVREDTISAWRRQTFGDLTSAFRFDEDKAAQPTLPDTTGRLESAIYEALHLPKPVLPSTNQIVPTQEKGDRKRVPSARTV